MDKICGKRLRCGQETRESQVADRWVGHDEFNCRSCETAAEGLMHSILDRVLKFEHNVNREDLFTMVYGPITDTNRAYRQSKRELWDRKGFGWWYCDLDLSNQQVVAKAMLARYSELQTLLRRRL